VHHGRSIEGEKRLLVAVVGGKLQGVEATYLAHKAGWEVRVVDKNDQVPASGLCDSFVQADVTLEPDLSRGLADIDLVIPALEDDDALSCLTRWCREKTVPFAFDPAAYAVSSSKLKSAELFSQIGLPVPLAWPDCGFPVLAKPSRGSGSEAVEIFHDFDALKRHFDAPFPPPGWVLQAYLEGSQHSLEIIGLPGHYRALQVTDLFVDEIYDCQRVVAPTILPPKLVSEFERLSLNIAEALNLHGIMDVEVILNREGFKVLEIDARLPSQTPITVYWSTGQNMVQLLGELFQGDVTEPQFDPQISRGTVYEHIRMSSEVLETSGEHIMAQNGPLYLWPDFFGADEAITNFKVAKDPWVATLIISASGRDSALAKEDRILGEIIKRFSIKKTHDKTAID
jgi:3-methylornithine--L-lysine ligase